MTASSQDKVVAGPRPEGRRFHRSLARKLTWRRSPYGLRPSSSFEAIPDFWFDQDYYLIKSGEGLPLKSELRHIKVYIGDSWAKSLQNVYLTFSQQLDYVSPSLVDVEPYEHYARQLEEIRNRLVHSPGEAGQWQIPDQESWQLDPPDVGDPQLEEPTNDLAQDRDLFWSHVPTDELIRRHTGRSGVKDIEELRLDFWESEEEFEDFIGDINEARHSDTI